MRRVFPFLVGALLCWPAIAEEESANELSYTSYIASDQPIKCMYGYFADKTGDHATAIAIFEDCIQRWDSVYSMISLAQIYESGVGVERDLEYATALMKRGALTDDPAGYSSLAKYHYGMALIEGKGTPQDFDEGIGWLEKAAQENVPDARKFLSNFNWGGY